MIIIDKKTKAIISIFTVFFIVLSTLFIYYAPAYALFANVAQKPSTSFLGGISTGQFICMPNNTFDIQTAFKACLICFQINANNLIDKPKMRYYTFHEDNLEIEAFDSLEIVFSTQKGDGKK